jgi:Uma2 family endonuclease
MSEPYEEIVEGEVWLRSPPGERHERICGRLHAALGVCLGKVAQVRLLPPRSVVQLGAGTMLRPDLAVVSAGGAKLMLAIEVISSEDHRPDTVTKKSIYEEVNVPRLWMVDPRYDNVETYHGTRYGLTLRGILAGSEVLTEQLLPGFELVIKDLFA